MKNKKILITGAAGFVGFHLSKYLLKNNFKIFGIDNYDSYYDIKIKKKRISFLIKNKKFDFLKLNIEDEKKLDSLFKRNKFDIVVHLAAQAGVRYSFINPRKYIKTNINGFFNIIEFSKKYNIEHFIYASSSSVYGLHSNKKSSERDAVNHPSSLYGATKRSNELIAHTYSHLYNMKTTGLRFFTIYGELGRPDMSIFKFFKNNLNNFSNDVYNYGKHFRSFTYIGDVTSAILKIIINSKNTKNSKLLPDSNKKGNFNIFNIGNEKIISLTDLLNKIEKLTGKSFKNNYLPLQKGDIIGSSANSKKLKKNFNFNFNTNIDKGLLNFYKWIKKNIKFATKLKS